MKMTNLVDFTVSHLLVAIGKCFNKSRLKTIADVFLTDNLSDARVLSL